ncbi:MAG: hypothetical protein KF858_01755 [Candidatus Sumerlaeia bacterium]|nr:hypothetical protein [Candidatus Sumerlaeia bacterium]
MIQPRAARFPGAGKRLAPSTRDGQPSVVNTPSWGMAGGLVGLGVFTLTMLVPGILLLGVGVGLVRAALAGRFPAALAGTLLSAIPFLMGLVFVLVGLLMIAALGSWLTRREVWMRRGRLHLHRRLFGVAREVTVDLGRIASIDVVSRDRVGKTTLHKVAVRWHPARPRPGKLAGRPLELLVANCLAHRDDAEELAKWLRAQSGVKEPADSGG